MKESEDQSFRSKNNKLDLEVEKNRRQISPQIEKSNNIFNPLTKVTFFRGVKKEKNNELF